MVLTRNKDDQYFLKDENQQILPKRVKQTKGRIMVTVNEDGHYYPLMNLKGMIISIFVLSSSEQLRKIGVPLQFDAVHTVPR